MNADDMPRLPQQNIQSPERLVKDLKPGERAVVMKGFAVRVDEDLRAWVDSDASVIEGGPLGRLSVQVERTGSGIILWLDKRTTFRPEKLPGGKKWIPVIEFREAGEDGL